MRRIFMAKDSMIRIQTTEVIPTSSKPSVPYETDNLDVDTIKVMLGRVQTFWPEARMG